jgi:hypothetical protein
LSQEIPRQEAEGHGEQDLEIGERTL